MYICMHAYIYACTYIHMYVCMYYVCMYTYAYIDMLITDCKAAEKILVENYDKLMMQLELNPAILSSLYDSNVITHHDKQVMLSKQTQMDMMTYLLDDVLINSLVRGVMDKYTKFVEVLNQLGEDDAIYKAIARHIGMGILYFH